MRWQPPLVPFVCCPASRPGPHHRRPREDESPAAGGWNTNAPSRARRNGALSRAGGASSPLPHPVLPPPLLGAGLGRGGDGQGRRRRGRRWLCMRPGVTAAAATAPPPAPPRHAHGQRWRGVLCLVRRAWWRGSSGGSSVAGWCPAAGAAAIYAGYGALSDASCFNCRVGLRPFSYVLPADRPCSWRATAPFDLWCGVVC